MTDVTLTDIKSGYNLSNLNDNFDKIESTINLEVVHNTGGNNVMRQALDMNGHPVLNAGGLVSPSQVGYETPVLYGGDIQFGLGDNTKTIDRNGIVYAPLPSKLPFTTTGTWTADDETKFFVVQGIFNTSNELIYRLQHTVDILTDTVSPLKFESDYYDSSLVTGSGSTWVKTGGTGSPSTFSHTLGLCYNANGDEYAFSHYASNTVNDLSDISTANWLIGGTQIKVKSPDCTLEVITSDGSGIPTAIVGVEARGIKQSLTFDNITEMKAQPAGLFVAGTRVTLQDYYGGWAVTTLRDPYPFSGVIASDATVVNIRGSAADNIGDHDLGTDINFLADTNEGYVNRVWGCRPGEDVDDNANLQAMFDAPRTGSSVNFRFVGGNQYIKPTTELEIANLAKVSLEGDDSALIYSGTDVNKFGLVIHDCNFVKWNGLDFDLNSQIFKGAVRIHDIRFQVKIRDVNFNNFASADSVGFECAQQAGFEIETINKNPANISNNSSPGLQMVNCAFGNEAPTLDTSFNYDNNFTGGTGVRLQNDCEYWRITNCGFFGNCIGLWIQDAANGSVVNCEFQEILGVTQKSFIGSGIPEGGGLYVQTTSDNSGKLNVSGCKFNHNWGFGIRSAYVSNNRPIHVTNCQFIANSFIAINITGTAQSSITDCYFERAHNYLSLPSWPWGSFGNSRNSFIYLGSGAINTTIMGNRGNDLPSGFLVDFDTGGPSFTQQKIADNTVSSTVTGSPNPFYAATPTIARNNDIMG